MNTEKNKWEVLETQTPYENAWIKLSHHQVINPSGNQSIYGVVHFKNIAVGIVPIDEEGNTYLVGQWRFPLNAYSWEIPEGGCPNGEEVEETAHRELKEETGLVATKLTQISTIHTSNSVCDEIGYVFLAEGLTQYMAQPEETEDLKIWKLPFKDALKMVLENKITDSISIAGILKVAILKNMF